MAHYRPSCLEDINRLAPDVRQADRDEIMASHGLEPLPAIAFCMGSSEECNTMIDDNKDIIGIFGVANFKNIGVPWMLSSERIYQKKIARQFLIQSKQWIDSTMLRYSVLTNYVSQENTKAIKWLKYLGFSFVRLDEQHGVGKKPFYEFIKIRS